jgi:hypothetical protein
LLINDNPKEKWNETMACLKPIHEMQRRTHATEAAALPSSESSATACRTLPSKEAAAPLANLSPDVSGWLFICRPGKHEVSWAGSFRILRALIAGGAGALACNVWAQSVTAPDPGTAALEPATFEGRRIATELPVELQQLIDAARRLHEEPGLILDRESIQKTVGARLIASKPTLNSRGNRILIEPFVKEGPLTGTFWKGRLAYFEYKESDTWSLTVELGYAQSRSDPGIMCYPSRLLEAYWGKPFIYRPQDVHAQLREWTRPPSAPPTGPHDGRPYTAEFRAPHKSSGSVSFHLGRGSCLDSISVGNLFKLREYSDDRIYYE